MRAGVMNDAEMRSMNEWLFALCAGGRFSAGSTAYTGLCKLPGHFRHAAVCHLPICLQDVFKPQAWPSSLRGCMQHLCTTHAAKFRNIKYFSGSFAGA